MDSRKNRGMGKIFPCFRPDVVDDHDDVNGRAFVQTNGKPPLGKKKTTRSSDESFFSSLSSSSDDVDSSVDGGGGGGSSRSSKGSSRRRFSKAIKAVFFDTSLSRKIRERKSRKNSFRSSSSLSSINDKSSPFEESSAAAAADDMNRINSSRSSIFSSSTNASSSLSSSCASSRNADSTSLTELRGSFRAESMDKRGSLASTRATNPAERKESFRGLKSMEVQKQKAAEKRKMDQYYSSTVGLCLLLVSLLVLVFWGRICAIFCTSVWLFVGPRRIKGRDSPENLAIARPVNVDSEEYKKRVIMEGLLERNRNRAAQ